MRWELHAIIFVCLALQIVTSQTDVPENAVDTAQTTPNPEVDLLGRVTSVTTSQCDDSEQCQCTVDAPLPCSYDVEYAELVRVRRQLEVVFAHVRGTVVDRIEVNLAGLVSRITILETSLHNQSISLSITELAGLQDQITGIQSTLRELALTSNSTVTQQLIAEVEGIKNGLLRLGTKNPIAVKADMDREIAILKSRLASCSSATNIHREGELDFIGDGIPANQTINDNACPSNYNITVGTPIAYKFRQGVPGMWFKDPLPVGEEEKTRVYELRHTWTTNQYLYYYRTLDDYEHKNFLTRATQSPCAFHIYGQKVVQLGGSFYWFDQYRANNLRRFHDIWDKKCEQIASPIKFNNVGFNYIGHTGNDADINFDETGFYVIYADQNGDLNIMKMNRETLQRETNWNTGKKKASVAAVFMICGRVYTIDDDTARHLTGLQWGYDTKRSKEFFYKADIESKFGDIQALSYNPREKALFAWDNGHAVLYPIYL